MSRSYTSAKREHLGKKPDFELDGVKFTCAGGLTALDISELAEVAELGVDTEDPRAAAAIAKFFRAALGLPEYNRLKDHMRAHDTAEDVLIDIMAGVIEDVAGRPTQEPSSSQDGPSTTGPMSRVVSLQRGSVFLGEPGSRAEAAVSSPSAPASSSPTYSLYG